MSNNTLYPNTFQHHNAYIDQIQFFLTGNEEKVLNRIVREIMGWEKGRQTLAATVSIDTLANGKTNPVTNRQSARGCGLSKSTIRKALKTLCEFGLIEQVGTPSAYGQTYRLQLDWDKINWEVMETRKAKTNTRYCQQMQKARDSNPLLLSNTPPVEQNPPPSTQQNPPPSTQQETLNPSLNPSLLNPLGGALSRAPTPPSCLPTLFSLSVKKVMAEKRPAADWRAILDAEQQREKPRKTLVQAVESKLSGGGHPAIVIYHDEMGHYPRRNQNAAIIDAVGNNGRLEEWRAVVHAWKLTGWNPYRLDGMIECFAEKRIPGQDRGRGKGKTGGRREIPDAAYWQRIQKQEQP